MRNFLVPAPSPDPATGLPSLASMPPETAAAVAYGFAQSRGGYRLLAGVDPATGEHVWAAFRPCGFWKHGVGVRLFAGAPGAFARRIPGGGFVHYPVTDQSDPAHAGYARELLRLSKVLA